MILNIVARCILILLGWKLPSHNFINFMSKISQKCVIIYAHTSYWDFFFLLLYRLTTQHLNNLYPIVNKTVYNRYNILMKNINAIPATLKQESNGGFINHTIDTFKSKSNYKILISPEGTLKSVPWRSGYYVLARELQIPIIIVSFDYFYHTLHYSGPYYTDCNTDFQTDYKKIENILQLEFSKTIPLHPSGSFVQINQLHLHPTVIDYLTFTTIIFPGICLYLTYVYNLYLGLIMTVGYIYSFLYHYSSECTHTCIEPITVIIGILSWFIVLIYNNHLYLNYINTFFIFLTLYFYYKGFGRKNAIDRTHNYILYHSLFHISFSIFSSLILYKIEN